MSKPIWVWAEFVVWCFTKIGTRLPNMPKVDLLVSLLEYHEHERYHVHGGMADLTP